MTPRLYPRLRLLMLLWTLAFAGIASPITLTYSGQNQARIVYDGAYLPHCSYGTIAHDSGEAAIAYDSASTPSVSEEKNRTAGTGTIFSRFVEFHAAKGTDFMAGRLG